MKNTATQPVIDIANPPAGAIPATRDQLHALGLTDSEIDAGEKRLESEHFGPWQICSSLRGIVEDTEFESQGVCSPKTLRARFYPPRKCSNPKQSGYAMEGRISLNGGKHHVFTSSQLFELPCGKLVNVGTLHLCSR